MGTKNLVMLKTHIDSINLCFFAVDFVYENVLWALASLWVFFCNYVLSSMGLILTYIFRFHRKNEDLVSLAEQTKRNQFEDYEIDGFTEELANLLFPKFEEFHITNEEEIEGETENSVLVEIDSDIQQDSEKREEREIDCCVYMHEDGKKGEGKIEGSFFMECVSNVNEDVKKIDENETECSVFMECDSNFQRDSWKSIEKLQEEEEKREGHVVMDTGSSAIISACQVVPQKEIGGFDFEEEEEEEEPMTFSFSFLQNYTSENVCGNAFLGTVNIGKEELSEPNLEEGHVAKKEEEMGYNNSCEGFECGSLKAIEDVKETQFSSDRKEVSHAKSECKNEKEGSSYNGEEACKDSLEKTEETMLEDELELVELDNDEDDEDEFEREHDELVEQIKLELRNARQGGLATILEEEEEEDEEKESPKVVGELKPLSIEEKKMEHKDHIVEIQKVYRCYAEKIRKLDVLNYQAMHAIGLLQLKDPLKLKLTPKSTVQNAKPLVYQNLWPRKAPKHTSDPMLKLVHELRRDLELVYVGQVCLSWEILCWQHMKIQELKKYDSQRPYRYNLVAGEFQLFEVLVQRFIEDEPFQQGTRIQNYVKNRCVIRNLLQVPAIKDDNTKDKKKIKWGEEDAIASERLAKIIEESMQVFGDFIRADKDYENVFNHKNGNDVEDIEISNLLRYTQTQLQKKERKLKDKVRSGNCIVRKFQKHHEDKIQLDHEQLLAQVGLRLISRVINMKKLRKDQLVWCNEKLNRIKFVDRKIQVEPSFLLFPC